MTLDVHGELHRLILRNRWNSWAARRCADRFERGESMELGCLLALSMRLTVWRPTWEERRDVAAVSEMEE